MAVIATIWLLWTLRLQNPTKHSHLYLEESHVDLDKLTALEEEHIAEWYINETEKLVVSKYTANAIEEEDLKAKIYK